MLAMISYMLITMIMVMIERWFLQFNWQQQADLNHPWQGVLQQSGPGQPRHPEQGCGYEGGETSQHQGPLPLQELRAGACDIKVENILPVYIDAGGF